MRAFEGFRDQSQVAMGERRGDGGKEERGEDDGGVAARGGEVKSWLKGKEGQKGEEVQGGEEGKE